jgi:signal transduction histidine kinase/CheY-like chemotaxis protein
MGRTTSLDRSTPPLQGTEALRHAQQRGDRLRRLHEAALAIAAPVPDAPHAITALLAKMLSGAAGALGAHRGILVLAERPAWYALVPDAEPSGGLVTLDGTDPPRRVVRRRGSAVAHVLATGEALLIPDIRADQRFGPYPRLESQGIRSFAAVPLRAGSDVLGALRVDFTTVGTLAAEDLEALELFAAHAAFALERICAAESDRRRVRDAERLAETLARVGAAPDVGHALEELIRGLLAVLDADHGVARLWDAATNELHLSVRLARDGEILTNTRPELAQPGSFSAAMQAGAEPIRVPDFWALDPASYPLYERMRARGLRAAVHVPIESAGQRFGSLSAEHREPGFFKAEQLAVARALATQAAAAIQRKRAEETLRAAIRLKDEFVSLVSHELRTPLTSIKGYVDLLIDGEVGAVSAEQTEFLQIVKNNADRLVSLINDLLDISRIEAGKIELKRAPVDVRRIVDGAAQVLRPQIEEKRQTLALDIPPDVPAVLGDEGRLIQVLNNLLSNAYKYTPSDGHIAVVARADGRTVRIAVSDTGVGMTPADQQRLFTKFFRAQNRATQEVAGTGLGLAITRQLVEMHGGQINVVSAPGAGSTFTVTLPTEAGALAKRRGRSGRAAPASGEAGAAPGGLVLVVDDEPDIAALIARYLRRSGYTVQVAHNGPDALRVARATRPALITLDVMLPGADGFTVLEWLKHDPQTAAIPVMMLSIVPDTGRGALLGALDYLTKPVDEPALIERVGQLVGADRSRAVLIADDDADLRGLLAGHLRRAGYDVLEAADGAEAVALAIAHRPGLTLLDVKMPRTDGIAALRALRAAPATRDLPVVMMTASPGVLENSRSTVDTLGGAALLAKPVTARALAAAIATGLASRAAR